MDFFTSPGFIIFLLLLILVLAGWILYLQNQIGKVRRQREHLMKKGDLNLEDILNEHTKGLSDHQQDLEMIYKIVNKLNNMASQGLQKVGVVRFNPFSDEGEGG
ncbi:DUF4446 family protein, partial [Patescibacteria group bacterium]